MQKTKGSLYQTLWRWHFFAGLLCIPFIILLAVTGSIYLFKPQIEAFRESTYRNITAEDASRLAPNLQISAAIAAIPQAKFLAYRLPQSARDAVRISIRSKKQTFYVYINPSSGSVLATVRRDRIFIEWVKNLHGELLIGKNGSLLVELAASWAILMIISGLYLALSSQTNGWWQAFLPYKRKQGRAFHKDLHTAIGSWVSVFALFLLISGLPWTTVWGVALKELQNFARSQTATSKQNLPSPAWRVSAADHYDLKTTLLNTANTLNFAPPIELSISDAKTNQWKLASMNQNRPLRATAQLAGDTGKLISIHRFEEKPMLNRVTGIGVAAHEGQLFGWFNQLLGLLTAIALIALSITGFFMWRARKPAKGFAAPERTGRWPLLLLLPMIFLPLALLSFLLILMINFGLKQIQRRPLG